MKEGERYMLKGNGSITEEKGLAARARREIYFSLRLIPLTFSLLLLLGCSGLKEAKEIKEAPMPPKYVETKDKESYRGEGSLWADRASLFEDSRAKRVNDLVTILITETTTAQKKATTNSSRASNVKDTMTNSLGLAGYSFPIKNLEAGLQGSGNTSFKGEGDTARTGTITASIAAKVVEVLPNGNLVLESRKETIINNDKEIIVVRGIIRPEDISPTNTILSQMVADAKIYIVGEGELDNKQSQGWLLNIMDKVWPF
ncbi:MAG: flagellar basal body L-ring protein FlgH [Nitrospirae bacterium]|nr:flagellar basal body L-ring protein FlgH [Nitrospirota bacterium]